MAGQRHFFSKRCRRGLTIFLLLLQSYVLLDQDHSSWTLFFPFFSSSVPLPRFIVLGGKSFYYFFGSNGKEKIGHFRATLERVTGAILGGKGKLDLGLWVDFWESSEARRVLPKFFFSFTIRFLSSGMGEQHHSCFGKHLHGRL